MTPKRGSSEQSAGAYAPEDGGSRPPPATIAGRRPLARWGERLGRPECPYMVRWYLDLRLFSVRLHRWVTGDDPRALHDHAWDFVTVVLRGGYSDVQEGGRVERLFPGAVRLRRAEHRHTVAAFPGGCWTLVLTGPRRRPWGFWRPRRSDGSMRWVKANRYFIEEGHHPCA